ncbi:I78 family peptidase inhibitor [Pseudorhodoferax sp.]|uniref:I78 family peptidase inhibitor n=1 Tax=Pseudorhodoferax sp. TaxID=1993553 RepID=UPI0039E337D2
MRISSPLLSFRAAAAAAALALAGCAGLPGSGGGTSSVPPPQAPEPVCNADAAQFALGQSFSPALEREVRARSGASIVRWLNPGQVITLEYNAMRINLTLDGRAKVVRVNCG